MTNIDKSKFEFVELDSSASEVIDTPTYSYWKSVFRQFFSKKSTIAMLILLIAILLMSFIYPMFSNFDFNDVSDINDFSKRYVWPNSQYWFGTDKNGQSLFDGVWYGARNSILISVIATIINMVIGLVVGLLWGISKAVDKIMIEIYNVISNLPFILIVMILTYSLGSGFWNLILAFCITGWVGIAYSIRVQVKIATKNLLPQLVSVIVTMVSQMLPSYISYEAFLSAFGIGLPVTEPSLGRLISNYSSNLTTNAYLFWIPLATLILVSLPLYIVGQNLADASDPRTHR